MTIPAPLSLYTTRVQTAWIDYNRHMMDGYYGVPFSHATDAFLDYVGLDHRYREQSGCSTYTAEGHICYLHELKEDAPLRIDSQLLGYDAKRMHLFHFLYHEEEGFLAATCEWMMIHVNVALGKGAPMPDGVQSKLQEILAVHATLPMPTQAGRGIAMRRKG